MKSSSRLLVVPLVVLLAACGGGEDNSAGMDGLIDGVPVSEYEATTTVPTSTTALPPTTLPPATTAPPETTTPPEPESEPEASDLEAWRSATAAVCEEYEPRIQALAAELAPPETLVDAAAYFDRLNPLNARYMRALVAIPVPEDGRDDVEALYTLADGLKETARVAQAAAHFDDQASFEDAVTELEVNSASANELLLRLELPQCVAAADGGTA